MIAAAIALTLASGTVPVEAVVASIRCDWRDAAAVHAAGPAEATLLLRLVDGAVPVDGGGSDEGRTVAIRLDGDDPALDCAPESRLAAPVVPIASLAAGETARGWFVLTRLGEVGEDDRARDRVASLVVIPFGQAIERIGALRLAQLLDHPTLLAACGKRGVWPRG